MKRLGIFAHYDGDGDVKRYILEHMKALAVHCERVVFVSTGELGANALAKAAEVADEVLCRPNVGFDFGSWKSVLDRIDLSAWDEVVLTNSSVFGPIGDGLDKAFARMEGEAVDFWGMTDNFEIQWHLQSYFLVFRRTALASEAFRQFWASVLPYKNKNQIIRSYEVGMTNFLQESGLRCSALVPAQSMFPGGLLSSLYKKRWRRNPTCFNPERLFELGMPYVKVELLRDNPLEIRLGPIKRRMRAAGFDFDLVEFDRPKKPRGVAKWMADARSQLDTLLGSR
ncbi:MAG: hypothetical protein EXR75_12200 [Myxococcales bacterium]|nr:hypothetical protein [Myxococcales bacterium]